MRPLTLDRELFDRLAKRNGSHLVSVFMPTHSKGRDVSQNPIRLKNLLSKVDTDLESLGFKPRQRANRLQPGHDLLEDREFWEHQGAGLALYIDDEGGVTPVFLSYSVDEFAVVMSVCLMRPLLEELTLPEIHVLALAKGEVGFFLAARNGARRVAVDLPESLDDVNWFVDRETQRQQHPDRTDSSRARHGHDPSSAASEDVNRFLREVDRALPDVDGLIVVLGDDDLVARFARVTDRRVISPENSGMTSPLNEAEVLESVRPLIEQSVSDRERATLDEALEQLGAGNALTDLTQTVPAAISGRIGKLVIDPSIEPVWGRVDDTTLEVTIHEERSHADVDLVDMVVVAAMENGADVTPLVTGSAEYPLMAVTRF
jgi:hypothetical protein